MLRLLILLLGPTAVGKTELSLGLCETFAGEVVNADSRQIYRGMDIGTAKPTLAERQRAPHHLIDIRNPDEPLSAAEYQQLAYQTIDAIHVRNRIPFLVGGTALYLRAVTQGLRWPDAPPNPALRAELEAALAVEGVAALYDRLQQLDPATAAVIDRNNPRRLVRALEIFLTTGRSKVELEGATPPPYRILQIGLTRPRAALYERIDRRVEQMVEQGLVEETQRLLAAGYGPPLPAMTSLGYREITAYLNGDMTLAEAVTKIKTETHRYVRYQETAFRKLPGVRWFDLEQEQAETVYQVVGEFLGRWPHSEAP
ncbi:MAG: tRNA (adenosine(37)-N6)-dimethylallyltransferase MiaA [Chloroflexi bacterium]|nr:MAG: tRNA (adenosine(37)-N6)-dimethylallyltransferase MiaA [Chloroflexota bacterium]